MTTELTRIDHNSLYVNDRVQALSWYQKMLRFRPASISQQRLQEDGPITMTNKSGSIFLAIVESDSHRSASVAFTCSGSEFFIWKEFFEKQGIKPSVADHQMSWSFFLEDPFGNVIEFTCHEYNYIRSFMDRTTECSKDEAMHLKRKHRYAKSLRKNHVHEKGQGHAKEVRLIGAE